MQGESIRTNAHSVSNVSSDAYHPQKVDIIIYKIKHIHSGILHTEADNAALLNHQSEDFLLHPHYEFLKQ